MTAEISERDANANQRPQTLQSAGSVQAPGSDRRNAQGTIRSPRRGGKLDKGPENVAGFLQDSAVPASSPGRSDRDRSTSRESSMRSAQLLAVTQARTAVSNNYSQVLAFYAVYDQLAKLTPDQQQELFPDGGYLTVFQDAARRYNESVMRYRSSQEQLERAQAALSGGQYLSGDVVNELNALMGLN